MGPCSLSAATTAIGLGSLAVSGLVAVRSFGVYAAIYAAIGVLVTLAISLGLLPGLLRVRPIPVPGSFGRFGAIRFWDRLAKGVSRHATVITGGAILWMILLGTLDDPTGPWNLSPRGVAAHSFGRPK